MERIKSQPLLVYLPQGFKCKTARHLSASRHNTLLLFMNSVSLPSCFPKAAKNSLVTKEEPIIFRDCAEAFKSGLTTSGLYTLRFPNSTEEVKVRRPAPAPGLRTQRGRAHGPRARVLPSCPPNKAASSPWVSPAYTVARAPRPVSVHGKQAVRVTDAGASPPSHWHSPCSGLSAHAARRLPSSVRLISLILQHVSSNTRV